MLFVQGSDVFGNRVCVWPREDSLLAGGDVTLPGNFLV